MEKAGNIYLMSTKQADGHKINTKFLTRESKHSFKLIKGALFYNIYFSDNKILPQNVIQGKIEIIPERF